MTVKQNYVSSILSLNRKDQKDEDLNQAESKELVNGMTSAAAVKEVEDDMQRSRSFSGTSYGRKRLRLKGPPDGGWGWWVVFASFMTHAIADGVLYTFGIFYFELIRYFDSSKGLTAWVPSIMSGMTLAIGPIASGLTNKFGCRAITIAGSILAAAGLFISVYAPSVIFLLFSIGLLTGAGFGLIYLPGIVAVTCYFDKKRAFATGIAVCGSGVGAAVFAPFTDFLIKSCGWKVSMVIISGLILTCALFGILFRPLEVEYEEVNEEEEHMAVCKSAPSDGMIEVPLEPDLADFDGTNEGGNEEEKSLLSTSQKRRMSISEQRRMEPEPESIFEEEDEMGDKEEEEEREERAVALPSSLPKTTHPHGLRGRRLMPSIRSDVNLKLMIADEPCNFTGPSSVLQSAPVQDSPTRHLSFSNPFRHHLSNLRSMASDSTNTVIAQTFGSRNSRISGSRTAVNRSTSKISSHGQTPTPKRKNSGTLVTPGPLERVDIFYSRSTLNLPQSQSKSNVMLYTASSATVSDYFRRAQAAASTSLQPVRIDSESSEQEAESVDSEGRVRPKRINFSRQVTVEHHPDIESQQTADAEDIRQQDVEVVDNGCCPQEMVQMFKLMMDFKILSNPLFLMFAISNFITSLGYYVPHIYIKDKAMDSLGEGNITQSDASNLIAMIGIGSTIGRLFFGYLSDWPAVNRLTLYNVCLTICGLSVICTSFTTSYTGLAFYSTIFGLFCGAYVSLISVILVDLLGLEKLTNAFGVLLLFQGVACLIGPPVIGWMYDLTNSYDPGFNLAGGLISLSGLMMFVVPYMETKPYIHMVMAELEAKKMSMRKQTSDLQSHAGCTDTVTTVIAVTPSD